MVMSEVILHTIVEKLEGIEIALFKENTEPKDDPSHQFYLRNSLRLEMN